MKRATLKRPALIARLAKDMQIAKPDARRLLLACVRHIRAALIAGEEVNIRTFGTFKLVERKPRIGRNPFTGEPVPVPDMHVVRFRPAHRLRLDVRQAAKRWRKEPAGRAPRGPKTRKHTKEVTHVDT